MVKCPEELQKRLDAKYEKRKQHANKTRSNYHAQNRMDDKILKSLRKDKAKILRGR